MTEQPVFILNSGMVTSVGLTAAATCAAIRSKLTNPSETRFVDSNGEWIMGHSVPLDRHWRGTMRLVKMAAMAIEECLESIPRDRWSEIPMLFCVAERERPGRSLGDDQSLFLQVQAELGAQFASQSQIIAHGRISAFLALMHARRCLTEERSQYVLIAAADSLLTSTTLRGFEQSERLLTSINSNGFMPGEGAAAILIGSPQKGSYLSCVSLGFATEPATIDSEGPLRGEGLARAIKAALTDSEREIQDLDFRITDISGEQYYFKEASLALSRIMRAPKEEFNIWHPAECIGESGAVVGVVNIGVADAACRKGYAPGRNVLCHAAGDSDERAAAVFIFQEI